MAAFLAALPAFIAALPDMMRLAVKMMTLIEKIAKAIEKHKILEWAEKVEAEIDELDKAQSPDEKIASARRISGLMRSLSK